MNEWGDTARRSLTNDGKRLAQAVSAAFGALPQVTAVAMAGSRIGPTQDDRSDVDLYVYVDEHIPADERIAIMHRFAERGEIDNRFWEPGDEWTDSASGIGVDLIYRTPCWIEAELDRVLIRHEASLGYSTCLWYNVLVSVPLYDRYGWFGQLRARAEQPYPTTLRRAIVARNHPVLRHINSSYLHQLELALLRGDLVSANHRLTAILAGYFDILFALNERPHPGEKRLVQYALASCSRVPSGMARQIDDVINALATTRSGPSVVERVNMLLDGLDALLIAEGFIAEH